MWILNGPFTNNIPTHIQKKKKKMEVNIKLSSWKKKNHKNVGFKYFLLIDTNEIINKYGYRIIFKF